MNTTNLIASAIALLWGAAILLNRVASDGHQGDGAYSAGQNVAIVFAFVLVGLGGRGLVKELGKRSS